ncbi:MAG: hypothetical protein ACK5LT_05695, partial [Lachnospirales bacterium]
MKKFKFLGILMATVVASSSLTSLVLAEETNGVKTITILGSSDLHGRIYPWEYAIDQEQEVGVAKIATLIEEE